MSTRVNYSGLVIAGIGFFLTRFTVTLAIYEEPIRFYLAGIVPLALGLGLAAFGVALAIADVEASLVRTTALWCVIGAGTMLVLAGLTLLGSTSGGTSVFATIRSRTYLSNFLIGGSVGGTLTGLYAARNRRQRDALERQANRLEVLNRLLRHEILNAAFIIRGYATRSNDETLDDEGVIEEAVTTIEQTIEEVKYLTWNSGTREPALSTIDLEECLTESIESIRREYPAARISVQFNLDDPTVRADEHVQRVFLNLLKNAVLHTTVEEPSVDVSVTATANDVRVSIRDDGSGLPESQQELLESGDIGQFDDPSSGFGLNVVRLLVERYGGAIETAVESAGTTITVVLPRAQRENTAFRSTQTGITDMRPAISHLTVTLGAAIIAGVFYGIAAEQLGGSVSFIGVYYGVNNAVVGWITHEFHSIVFAFVFAGIVSQVPATYRNHVPAYVAIGAAWSLVLWFVAAGIISPIWLRLLDIPAPIPNLSLMLLVSHLVWGISLGVVTAWGYEYVSPQVERLGGQLHGDYKWT